MDVVFRSKKLDMERGKNVLVMNEETARSMNLNLEDRVEVFWDGGSFVAVLELSEKAINLCEVGITRDVWEHTEVPEEVYLRPVMKPDSVSYIKRRLLGSPLKKEEIRQIIFDLMDNKLSDVESAYFVASAYVQRLSFEEEQALTDAMVKAGDTLSFSRGPVLDKHCIGGVPGNRTTPIVVPIVAAAGYLVPKTSSRAITSPAGTADVMEVLCDVAQDADRMKTIVESTGAAMVWGGAIDLAPADDLLLKLRYPLRLDPVSFLLSSILAKKKAVGAEKVLIDIPLGGKVKDFQEAQNLARRFHYLGENLGMEVRALVTDGSQPIGRGIGAALEARDVISVLRGEGPADLKHKAVGLAGEMLDMAGEEDGRARARELLEGGRAYEKFREIIGAQGGDPEVKPEDLEVGKHTVDFQVPEDADYLYYDSEAIAKLARVAGSPGIKSAGIELLFSPGSKVSAGETVLRVHTPVEARLESIRDFLKKDSPLISRSMIIEAF